MANFKGCCTVCNGLCRPFDSAENVRTVELEKSIQYFLTYQELLSWSSSGCPFANYLTRNFKSCLIEPHAEDDIDGQLGNVRRWHIKNKSSQAPQVYLCLRNGYKVCISSNQGQSEAGELQCFTISFGPSATGGLLKMRSAEVFTIPDDPAAKYLSGRPVKPDIGSLRSFGVAKSWLSDCLNNHQNCPKLMPPPPLPTRVIDVRAPNLCLGVGIQAPYAALSYCWGKVRQFTTTTHNLNANLKSINLPDLPKSIQDAITATRELGLHYLWVDAICIIQDSHIDKEKEIGMMAEIYRNCIVMISAASASDSNQGFLEFRSATQKRLDDVVRLRYPCPDGQIGSIYFIDSVDYGTMTQPIDHRGWTQQERLLSPRILKYSSHRLEWKCPSQLLADGGLDPLHFLTCASQLPSHFSLGSLFESSRVLEDQDQEERERWWDIVGEYSGRKLSKPEDKLPALSGIAMEWQRNTGDMYYAGLWGKNLMEHLMWYQSVLPGRKASRAATYRSPSWSWASVDETVTFERYADSKALHTRAEILHCNVEPKSDLAPLGEVNRASLTIRGPLKTMAWEELSGWFKIRAEMDNVLRFDGHNDTTQGMLLSPQAFVRNATSSKHCCFLELSTENVQLPDRLVRRASGMALVRLDNDVFERFGWFKLREISLPTDSVFKEGSWDDGVEIRTLKIH